MRVCWRRGETVKAFVALKEGETAIEEEVIAFCRENLAAYRVPRIVEFRTDLLKPLEEEAQRVKRSGIMKGL